MSRQSWTDYVRRDEEGTSFTLVEEALEIPMMVLSLLFAPVVLGPLLADLSSEATRGLTIVGAAIWLAFALEFALLLYLAPNRRAMVRTHKLSLAIVLLPVLRPLQLLRLATVAGGLGRGIATMRRIGGRDGVRPYFASVLLFIVAGAGFALAFEHDQPGAQISSYGDALWWALVTCTTVGYGDHFPVTGGGRSIAVVLMLVGIGGLSLLTASVAAVFLDEDDDPELDAIRAQLDRIEDLLSRRPPGGL